MYLAATRGPRRVTLLRTDRKARVMRPIWGPEPHPLAPRSSSCRCLQQRHLLTPCEQPARSRLLSLPAVWSPIWRHSCGCRSCVMMGGCPWPLGVDPGDAAKPPATHRTVSQQRSIWPENVSSCEAEKPQFGAARTPARLGPRTCQLWWEEARRSQPAQNGAEGGPLAMGPGGRRAFA